MQEIQKEAKKAFNKFGHFNSTHELYGVLIEEVDEFYELVRQKPNPKKAQRMIEELTQVAAVAYRGVIELQNQQIKHV